METFQVSALNANRLVFSLILLKEQTPSHALSCVAKFRNVPDAHIVIFGFSLSLEFESTLTGGFDMRFFLL
jgi:hypothetical protein